MAGVANQARTVLLATEKAFAPDAVSKIETVFSKAGNYTLKKLENYKSKGDLLDVVSDVDALIIRSDIVDADVVEAATKAKLVVRAGAGYDNIDLHACENRSIVAMNTPGQNANAVAELVFGMMLTSARNAFDGTSGFELCGKSIGFYGFGAVAQAVHRLATGFGMRSFAYNPSKTKETIMEMGATPVDSVADLFECQYVSLHVPLTANTRDSVTKELMMKLPCNGTLINTARAEVVHEADLLEVLEARPDFRYLSDVAAKNVAAVKEIVGEGFGKRVIFSKKKMGAQTIEANNNAGVAAANQIVGFFEHGNTTFSLNP